MMKKIINRTKGMMGIEGIIDKIIKAHGFR